MPAEFEPWLARFAAVLARTAGLLAFMPLPGLRQAPVSVRLLLALALALVASPAALGSGSPPAIAGAAWNLPVEAAFGLAAGIAAAWVIEVFTLGLQLISVQAGFSFASTIDPATQADSGVLQVAGQLGAGLLFVGLGFERDMIAAFASSLNRAPPGAWLTSANLAALVVDWTATAVLLAFRLALPVMALMLLLDLALALMSRTQPQLQLIGLALPVKLAATLLMLAGQASGWTALLGRAAAGALDLMANLGAGR